MPPPSGPKRQPRICIRYPFDISFFGDPAQVDFVADGVTQPRGGTGFTVEGTLFADTDVMFMTPLSNTITTNVTQGIWTLGPFTDPVGNPLPPGNYLFRVRFMQMGVVMPLDEHVITIQLF